MVEDRKNTPNPAWRPAQKYSERLASISHHLLGNRKSTGDGPVTVHRLPVLLALEPGHPGALQADSLVDALSGELNRPSHGNADSCWEVYATERPDEIDPAEARFVLVLASASLPGVRLAYARIKLLTRTASPQMGVLLSGTGPAERARRCQERLVEGALWFLDLSLIEFGHIDAPAPESNQTLARAAEKIRDLWTSSLAHKE
jgi:hypothetical protein